MMIYNTFVLHIHQSSCWMMREGVITMGIEVGACLMMLLASSGLLLCACPLVILYTVLSGYITHVHLIKTFA